MKNRIHLYVPRNHAGVWLMALCMAASAAGHLFVHGKAGLLPGAAAVLYGLIACIAGKEMFYKTAIALWMLGVSWAIRLWDFGPLVFYPLCACVILACGLYTAVVSGHGRRWMLLPVYLAALGAIAFFGRENLAAVLPDLLMLAGMLALLPAMKIHNDGKYHPTWGDRAEGRRIRTAPAMEQITAYFMPARNGAHNLFEESVEVTELERYVRRKRREGLTGFGPSHVIMAAYVRTVARYPALNRFIAGQKIYSRGEDIALCMTVKKEMTTSAPDSLLKVHLHPADTAEDVYHKFKVQLENAKNEMENTDADNTAGAFMMIPGLVLKFTVWLLKLLDYFGLVPGFLLEVSPFHGSVYFTSMGSLGIKPVYHHLYDFGTVPAFCAFGRKRRAEEIVGGEIQERKYMDLRFTLDERICDGFYYASVIKYFLRLLSHPDLLDTAPETVERDIP